MKPVIRLAAGNSCAWSIRLWFVLICVGTLPGPKGSVTTGIPVIGSGRRSIVSKLSNIDYQCEFDKNLNYLLLNFNFWTIIAGFKTQAVL